MEVRPYAGTTGDSAISEDRGRIDTGVALENRVSHLCLIIPEEALTAVANVYLTLFPAEADEVHEPCELLVRQLQIGLSRGTSNWEDRKDTPPFYAHLDQKILEEHQILEVVLVYASHHIPDDLLFLGQHTDGIQCLLETFRITAKPVMRFLETIQADSRRVQSGSQERVEPFPGHQITIGDDPPRISPAIQFQPAFLDILTNQRLASGKDDEHFVRLDVRRDIVYDFQEVFDRHIRDRGRDMAIAPAMTAGYITTKRTLPKECTQFM